MKGKTASKLVPPRWAKNSLMKVIKIKCIQVGRIFAELHAWFLSVWALYTRRRSHVHQVLRLYVALPMVDQNALQKKKRRRDHISRHWIMSSKSTIYNQFYNTGKKYQCGLRTQEGETMPIKCFVHMSPSLQ